MGFNIAQAFSVGDNIYPGRDFRQAVERVVTTHGHACHMIRKYNTVGEEVPNCYRLRVRDTGHPQTHNSKPYILSYEHGDGYVDVPTA